MDDNKEFLFTLFGVIVLIFLFFATIPESGTYKVRAAKVDSFGFTLTKGYSRSLNTDKGTYKISDANYYIFLDLSANKCYDLTISRALLTGEFVSGAVEVKCVK